MLHLIHFRTWLYGGENEVYMLKLSKSNRQSQKSVSLVSLAAWRKNCLFRIGKISHRVGREMQYEQVTTVFICFPLLTFIFQQAQRFYRNSPCGIYSGGFSSWFTMVQELANTQASAKTLVFLYYCIHWSHCILIYFSHMEKILVLVFPLFPFSFQMCWELMKLVIIELIRASNHTQGWIKHSFFHVSQTPYQKLDSDTQQKQTQVIPVCKLLTQGTTVC